MGRIKLVLFLGALIYGALYIAGYIQANANIFNFKIAVEQILLRSDSTENAIAAIRQEAELKRIQLGEDDPYVEYSVEPDKTTAYAEMSYETDINFHAKLKDSFDVEKTFVRRSQRRAGYVKPGIKMEVKTAPKIDPKTLYPNSVNAPEHDTIPDYSKGLRRE